MRSPHEWAGRFCIPIEAVREIQRDAMLAIAIKDCGDDPPPRSRVEFRLSVGAESRERLAQVLEDLADRIRHSPNHHHPIEASGLWGGAGSHGHHELSEHEGVSKEAYEAELQAWSQRHRWKRQAVEAPSVQRGQGE